MGKYKHTKEDRTDGVTKNGLPENEKQTSSFTSLDTDRPSQVQCFRECEERSHEQNFDAPTTLNSVMASKPTVDDDDDEEDEEDWEMITSESIQTSIKLDLHADIPQSVSDLPLHQTQRKLLSNVLLYYDSTYNLNEWDIPVFTIEMSRKYPHPSLLSIFKRYNSLVSAKRFQAARCCLQQASTAINTLLETGDLRLMLQFWETITSESIIAVPELADALIWYFTKSAFLFLGPNHPVTISAFCICQASHEERCYLVSLVCDYISKQCTAPKVLSHTETVQTVSARECETSFMAAFL